MATTTNANQTQPQPRPSRHYTPIVVGLSILVNVIVVILFFLPGYEGEIRFDLAILPMMNAIFNSFTFVFLLAALFFIKQKNVKMHRRFIYAAFTTTVLFLLTYISYHFFTEPTIYGGEGVLRGIYYFVLISHIVLAVVIVPLALFSLVWGLSNQISKHRKIVRWTMPLWLYVSATGVLVYLMISPYY